MNSYFFSYNGTEIFTITNSKSFQCPKIGESIRYDGFEYIVVNMYHTFGKIQGSVVSTGIILELE